MKPLILAAIFVAFCGFLELSSTQEAHIRTLPYRHRKKPSRHVRVRRQALNGKISSNPNGGGDTRLDLTNAPEHNVIEHVFAAGNAQRGPVSPGDTLVHYNNGLVAAIAKEDVPDVRGNILQSVNANIFNNGEHSLDDNAFRSKNTLENDFKFERSGPSLNYNYINGHGPSLMQSTIPKLDSQLELDGRADLPLSKDRKTRLDAFGRALHWRSGPLSGQNDVVARVGLSHMYG